MFGLGKLSAKRSIIGILAVFALWCALSVAWYVCGVNGMCIAQNARAQTLNADPAGTDGIVLSQTQQPIAAAYDRAGAAGEMFMMLMIAFTLGALLGRILAAPAQSEQPTLFDAPKQKEGPPIGRMPSHISEFTKHLPQNPRLQQVPPPSPRPTHPQPQPIVITPKPVITKSSPAPAPQLPQKPISVIHLDAPKVNRPFLANDANDQQKPKMRFNTSWNNPNRGNQKQA